MAYFREQPINVPCDTTENLSACQHHFVQLSGDNLIELVDDTVDNNPVLGVLQNKPSSGQGGDVCILGCTKVRMGTACSYGDKICAADSGWGTLVDSGTLTQGFVIHGCNSGLIATAMINCVNAISQLS